MIRQIVNILLGALILSFAAFYNRFPLLTHYSGDYINSGFKRTIPEADTAIYGLFITQTSWTFSIWLVVFSQAILLSLILYYCFRYFSRSHNFLVYYMGFIFFITFLMAASVSVSTIGVGVFLPISILSLSLLLFAKKLPERDLYIIGGIAVISIGMSILNLVSVVLVTLAYTAIFLIKRILGNSTSGFAGVGRLLRTFAVIGVSGLLVLTIQYALESQFLLVPLQSFVVPESVTDLFSKGLSNLVDFQIAKYSSTVKNTSFTSIEKWFNWELREAFLSQQIWHGVTFKVLSYTQLIFAIVSVILFVYMFLNKKVGSLQPLFRFCLISFFLLIIINPFFKSVGNTWELIWILSLPAFILLAEIKLKKPKDVLEPSVAIIPNEELNQQLILK